MAGAGVCSSFVLGVLLLGSAARASTLVTFTLDGSSQLIPAVGAAQALSGFLQVEVGEPSPGANTPFDLVDLEVLSSGGTRILLNPAVVSPGLGVLSPLGDFLVATLFLHVASGGFDLAIPDLTGSTGLPLGPGSALTTSFQIDSGGAGGLLSVALQATAVPEPASALLVLAGLAGLSGLRSRGRIQG